MSADLELEPVPGLPEELPDGEKILWQGRPNWRTMAVQTFRVKWVGFYLAALVLLRAGVAIQRGEGSSGAVAVISVGLLAAACIGILYSLSWLHARATVYTITDKRIAMRIGVALPMTWNLPFARLAAADLDERQSGDGDIVLKLADPDRIGWLYLWPHVKPWTVRHAQPALRTLHEPGRVAGILRRAVQKWADNHDVSLDAAETLPVAEHRPLLSPAARPSAVAAP